MTIPKPPYESVGFIAHLSHTQGENCRRVGEGYGFADLSGSRLGLLLAFQKESVGRAVGGGDGRAVPSLLKPRTGPFLPILRIPTGPGNE